MLPRAALPLSVLLLALPSTFAACKQQDQAGGGSSVEADEEALPKLDEAAAARALDAVAGAPPEVRKVLATAGLAELEAGRLDADFLAGWKAVAEAAPEFRSRLAAKAILDNVDMLDEACEAEGAAVMRELAAAAPGQKAELMWTKCGLERHGLVDAGAAKAADASALTLAHMAFAHIEARGGVTAEERELLAMSATLPPS